MREYHESNSSALVAESRTENVNCGGETSFYSSTGSQGMEHDEMSERLIKEKFLRDHRMLLGKAAVVAALALDVLRGDEELASALRLKGEELYRHLLIHMRWEERLLDTGSGPLSI